MNASFTKIVDEKGPERLRGKTMRLIIKDNTLRIECEMPVDATNNELYYLQYVGWELVDLLELDVAKVHEPKLEYHNEQAQETGRDCNT